VRYSAKEKHQGKCRREGKVIGKRRGSKVHRRLRISPEMPVGAAELGDGFRRFQRELARGKKGVGGGDRGIFIATLGVEEGLGLRSGGGDQTDGDDPVKEEESLPEVGDDTWDRASVRERGRARTGSGWCLDGPWAAFLAGPKVIPRPFSYFIYFFSFSFSIFRFVSNLLQIWFKLIQQNS
jgi:hypothetical protein